MNRKFAMGAATTLGVVMMIQDWYGLDGYIQHVRDHWIELPWWVGGVIAAWCAWLGRDKVPNAAMGDDENCMTERERFEAWMQREHPAKNSMDWTSLERDDERPDEYMMRFTWAAWSAWQARSKVPNACGEPGLTEPGKD